MWQAANQVYEETGHRAIYCANITDRPDRIIENAHRAQELGAGMVITNAISVGLGMVQALAEDTQFTSNRRCPSSSAVSVPRRRCASSRTWAPMSCWR